MSIDPSFFLRVLWHAGLNIAVHIPKNSTTERKNKMRELTGGELVDVSGAGRYEGGYSKKSKKKKGGSKKSGSKRGGSKSGSKRGGSKKRHYGYKGWKKHW